MGDGTESNALEQRSSATVEALEAENVGTDEDELWFDRAAPPPRFGVSAAAAANAFCVALEPTRGIMPAT